MNKNLLAETIKLWDTVDLRLCIAVHEVCNDIQFEYSTPLEFSSFLNLDEYARPIAVKPREKLRVGYMVEAIARNITPRKEATKWTSLFLQRCGIQWSYYVKHRTNICSDYATDDNRNYRNALDMAIDQWRKRLTTT